jgi:hypothetical protein
VARVVACERIVAVALAVVSGAVVAGWTATAAAGEPGERGISLSAWAGGAIDRSATDGGRRVNAATPLFGATGVGNIERVAIGGAIDAAPEFSGAGSLSLGALLGYQQQVGRTRLRALAEGGERRFSPVVGAPPGANTWIPYAGVRLGAARTIPAHGFIEVGVAWLARTDDRLDGFMTAVGLEIGVRLEAPHPWNQGTREP